MIMADCKPGTVVITPTKRRAVVVRKFLRDTMADRVELRYLDGDQATVNLKPSLLTPEVRRVNVA